MMLLILVDGEEGRIRETGRSPCVDPKAEDLSTQLFWFTTHTHTHTFSSSFLWTDLAWFSHAGRSSDFVMLLKLPSTFSVPVYAVLNCQSFLSCRDKDKVNL